MAIYDVSTPKLIKSSVQLSQGLSNNFGSYKQNKPNV